MSEPLFREEIIKRISLFSKTEKKDLKEFVLDEDVKKKLLKALEIYSVTLESDRWRVTLPNVDFLNQLIEYLKTQNSARHKTVT